MISSPDLFRTVQGALVPAASDICANRHRGNAESVQANPGALSKAERRALVLRTIAKHGSHGATCDEIAVELKTTPNCVSGRLTELRKDFRIMRKGTRLTRSNSPAAVWIAA